MTDARDALKAKFDAIATAPASTFTSFGGYRRAVDTGTGKTANRFIFFRIGSGIGGRRGASNGVDNTEGELVVVATLPWSVTDEDVAYEVIAQLDNALGTSRQITSGGRTYAVRQAYEHDPMMVTTLWPWGAGQEYSLLRATFSVFYAGV